MSGTNHQYKNLFISLETNSSAPSVVAYEWMINVGQMDADLMGLYFAQGSSRLGVSNKQHQARGAAP